MPQACYDGYQTPNLSAEKASTGNISVIALTSTSTLLDRPHDWKHRSTHKLA